MVRELAHLDRLPDRHRAELMMTECEGVSCMPTHLLRTY